VVAYTAASKHHGNGSGTTTSTGTTSMPTGTTATTSGTTSTSTGTTSTSTGTTSTSTGTTTTGGTTTTTGGTTTTTGGTTTTTSTPPPPAPKIYWGTLIGSQFTGAQPPWDWNSVTDFQNTDAAGKGISVLHFGGQFYASWCAGYCTFPASAFDTVRNAGVIPFYSWGSSSDQGVNGYTDAQIAAGSQDAYITSWAQAAKAWGHPFFLRFDWEMNGNWFPFGVGANGNTAADYVAMWRHVHDIFKNQGATNASFTWCPNIDQNNTLAPLTSLYPGDAYVDWTCLDGYNGDVPWTSFHDLFSSTYNTITGTLAPSKPMIVGETATTESGGSKAQWISAMLSDLPVSFPKIRGVLWYDRADSGPGGHTDWPIESSSTSEAAFGAGIASSTFTASSYASLPFEAVPLPS
jgi:Glycosyl hydrolase family 26